MQPPSLGPKIRAAQEAEAILRRFDRAWQSGTAPRIEEFLTTVAKDARRALLEELIKIDLEYRWRAGAPKEANAPERWRLEDYVTRYRGLGQLEQLPLDLIGQEYEVRRSWGDRPSHDEYATRFPGHGANLRQRLQEIDSELAEEFAAVGPATTARRRAAALPFQGPEAAAVPPPSVPEMMETLRRLQLLGPAALEELAAARPADRRTLARELHQRGWLTPYQVNQLVQGRGADLVLGQYVIREKLGEGGTGQVFRARHQKMDREVALKVIRRELLADADVVARFYREVQIVSRCSHPNIVHAFDAGPVGATHMLVMEYVEGIDLTRLVKRIGPLSVAVACDYVRQAAAGLQHAHEQGLVHRDIKPPNLILTRVISPEAAAKHPSPKDNIPQATPGSGLIKILDLGLARLQQPISDHLTRLQMQAASQDKADGPSNLTPVGAILMGTPDYMAPEQALDFHRADIRADIYSLGCTLFFLLTGKPPFPGGTPWQKLARHQQDEPPAVEQMRPDVPPEVSAVLARMLAKRPQDRYHSPAEVVAALTFALAQSAPSVAPAPRRGWSRRRWLVINTVGGSVLLAELGLLLYFTWPRRPQPTPPPPGPLGPPQRFTNSLGIEMVLIPEGRFVMGSPASEPNRMASEGPQHEVRITRPFYMSACEVTQGQYQKVMGANPSQFTTLPGGTANHPAENMTWEEAVEFCRKLSALDAESRAGRYYRLPTEAEWEYACRAGSTSAFGYGDDPTRLAEHAWITPGSQNTTHPVGLLKPNAWGLYDMLGNVFEYCAEYEDHTYYQRSPTDDPPGATSGPNRACRGGGWNYDAVYARCAARAAVAVGRRGPNVGIRLVCNVPASRP